MFAEFVAGMEDTRLPECVMFGELVKGAGCVEGQKKDCMSPGRPQSFRCQRRPVDNCSPAGRGRMAQDAAEQGVERFMTKWITTQFRTRVFVFQVFSVQGGNSTDVKIHSSEVKMYSADVKIQVKIRNHQIAI